MTIFVLVAFLSGQRVASPIGCVHVAMPPLPEMRPYSTAEAGSYDELIAWSAETSLGIGHLRPDGDVEAWPYDRTWGVPLYESPRGPLIGWLMNGRLMSGGRTQDLRRAGMVETGYELPTFVVFEHRADGWLRIRYRLGSSANDGMGWVHLCHLRMTETPIAFEPWEQRFLSRALSPLFFRSAMPHVLRRNSSTASASLRTITGDHHLEPLEIRGDWMRVRLVQPSTYCARPGESATWIGEGWIQWRSEDRGPWVWYHTRGC